MNAVDAGDQEQGASAQSQRTLSLDLSLLSLFSLLAWFHPLHPYKVISWFQAFAFSNAALCRYVVAQGYCYILTHPGTPTIFWDHLFEWNDGDNLHDATRDMMAFRAEQGIHCRSVVKILKAEQSVYAAQIDDSVIMKIGPGQFAPDDGQWEYAMHGNDYCIWKARR
jgi:hypothetical protein